MIAARYGLVFRINESSAAFGMYGALAKVAVHTALTHTSLQPRMLVMTWNGIWLPQQWHKPRNILWRGDQSNWLVRSNHLEQWEQADKKARANWSKGADSPFQ
jgi:hypothetical protein